MSTMESNKNEASSRFSSSTTMISSWSPRRFLQELQSEAATEEETVTALASGATPRNDGDEETTPFMMEEDDGDKNKGGGGGDNAFPRGSAPIRSSSSGLLLYVLLFGTVFVFGTLPVFWRFHHDDNQSQSSLPATKPHEQQQQQQQHDMAMMEPTATATCPIRFNKTAYEMVVGISVASTKQDVCQKEMPICHCNNATTARPPTVADRDDTLQSYLPLWETTTARNKEWASRPLLSPKNNNTNNNNNTSGVVSEYDVVFLGDSIVEHFQGTDLGREVPILLEIKDVFDSRFSKAKGRRGQYEGLALGIGGDMAPQLMYRIDNEEINPTTLNAKVFWIVIGTNDMGYAGCNGETVAAGNIMVAEKLLKKWPNSKVVLNSVLPRQGGEVEPSLLHRDFPQWENHATVTNQWLECYAAEEASASSHRRRVDFFNATPYFVNPENNETLVEEYYQDVVHPSALGCANWLDGIVKRLQEYDI